MSVSRRSFIAAGALAALPLPAFAQEKVVRFGISMALLRNSGLRRDAPFPLQLQAARMISAVPRAEKRFMRATRI